MLPIHELIPNSRTKDMYLSVRKKGTVSKQTLLEESGLTVSTLTRILDELLAQNLLLEVGFGESTGGRRPTLYETNPTYGYVFGLEISRTFSKLVLADLHLNLLDEYSWTMDEHATPERLIESVHAQVLHMLEQTSIDISQVIGLGIGAVGPLDRKEGTILQPAGFAAPGWSQVRVRERLEQLLDVPVCLDNGANTALLGEYWASGDRRQHQLLYLHAGIGLRSAIMNEGRILYGVIDTEGAVGQMIIESSGVPSSVPGGNSGAWESYVSIRTLEMQAREEWKRGRPTLLRELADRPEDIEFAHLIEALQAGDSVVNGIFGQAAAYCGIGLANLINVLHPEEVILGGPLFSAADFFFQEATRTALEKTYYREQYKVRFTQGSLSDTAVAAGAAALILNQLTG
ncbi:ROK family protein [Paenibacillus graminis]|uniref:ROK family protein n=1 Tax=Paenibacillus graminis TaxID=189425 RepID=UPI002DB983EE|nr:ROK family protein [Paenibacillus graminis]MEC0170088.1 ROK family protein [Paenibacillus graminis]